MASALSEIAKGIASGASPAGLANTVLSIGQDLIDRLLPDRTAQAKERAAAQAHLIDVAAQHESDLVTAAREFAQQQSDINKIEAASASLFKSGWRPGLGWVGVVSLFMYYVPYCIVATVVWARQCWMSGTLIPRPDLGIMDLIALVSTLLGVGGMRSVEKLKGVA